MLCCCAVERSRLHCYSELIVSLYFSSFFPSALCYHFNTVPTSTPLGPWKTGTPIAGICRRARRNLLESIGSTSVCYQSQVLASILGTPGRLGHSVAGMQCQRCGARFTQASVGAAKVSETTTSTKFRGKRAVPVSVVWTIVSWIGRRQCRITGRNRRNRSAWVPVNPPCPLEGAVVTANRAEITGAVGMGYSASPRKWRNGYRFGTTMEMCVVGHVAVRTAQQAVVELSAIMYTLRCSTDWSKYERAAFGDRRAALVRRVRARQGGSTCSAIVDAAASNVRLIARITTTCFWQYEHEQWLSGQQHGSVERD
jgi:hypothetical protein